MPRYKTGKRVAMGRGRLWLRILLLSPLAALLLLYLNWLVNWDRTVDPAMEQNATERDQYRPGAWAEKIEMQNETAVWYSDRVRDRFLPVDRSLELEEFGRGWRNFCSSLPAATENYIVPIPPPIVFEEGFGEDRAAYWDFCQDLSQQAGETGTVVDLYEALAEHKEEFTYYGITPALTNRGAYYAANALLLAMEGEGLPPLEDYVEEMYRTGLSTRELTYLYSLPGSKDRCEVFSVTDNGEIHSLKAPVLRKSGIGPSSVLWSSQKDWAVVEGDGPEERGDLFLIGDRSGQALVPFLANYYHRVYFIFSGWNRCLGSAYQPLDKIFAEFHIEKTAYVQWTIQIGQHGVHSVLNEFVDLEEEGTDG